MAEDAKAEVQISPASRGPLSVVIYWPGVADHSRDLLRSPPGPAVARGVSCLDGLWSLRAQPISHAAT